MSESMFWFYRSHHESPWKEHGLLPSSEIFCASVQKAMLGSSRWNRAHDLERKLGPWKQARVMWLPWRLIEPPSCTASSGRGIWNREMWQPAITFSTPGQWRWCAASMSVWQRRIREHRMRGRVGVGRQIDCDWNMRHVAAGNRISCWALCCFHPFTASNHLKSHWLLFVSNNLTRKIHWIQLLNHIVSDLSEWIPIKCIRITNQSTSYSSRTPSITGSAYQIMAQPALSISASSTEKDLLTELCRTLLCVDDGGFGRQIGAGAPGGEGPLAGVELLCEKLLQLHADLD